jgi:hypothetical protein
LSPTVKAMKTTTPVVLAEHRTKNVTSAFGGLQPRPIRPSAAVSVVVVVTSVPAW